MPGHIKLLSKLDSNFKKGEERLRESPSIYAIVLFTDEMNERDSIPTRTFMESIHERTRKAVCAMHIR